MVANCVGRLSGAEVTDSELRFFTVVGGQGPDFDVIGNGVNATLKWLLGREENVLPDELMHRGAGHSKQMVLPWAFLFEAARAACFGVNPSPAWLIAFLFLGVVHLCVDHINGPLGQMLNWPRNSIRTHSRHYLIPDTEIVRCPEGKLRISRTCIAFGYAFGVELCFLLPIGLVLGVMPIIFAFPRSS